MQTVKLKKGHTLADVTEAIEAEVVKYMAGKRRLGEQAFRALLDKDSEVRASYSRKIARLLRATGLNPAVQVCK
jgi:hypothetical protein